MGEEPEKQEPGDGVEIIIQPEQMAGVWANFAVVNHSPYEFTLDFVRLDFSRQPTRGIVVSRVALSPRFIDELIQALQANWQKYAQKALPQEVYGAIETGRHPEAQAPGLPAPAGDDSDDDSDSHD